ncbi:MAG: hypothetical protein MHM6MM_002273 [Cercozoa sp. M6MM]
MSSAVIRVATRRAGQLRSTLTRSLTSSQRRWKGDDAKKKSEGKLIEDKPDKAISKKDRDKAFQQLINPREYFMQMPHVTMFRVGRPLMPGFRSMFAVTDSDTKAAIMRLWHGSPSHRYLGVFVDKASVTGVEEDTPSWSERTRMRTNPVLQAVHDPDEVCPTGTYAMLHSIHRHDDVLIVQVESLWRCQTDFEAEKKAAEASESNGKPTDDESFERKLKESTRLRDFPLAPIKHLRRESEVPTDISEEQSKEITGYGQAVFRRLQELVDMDHTFGSLIKYVVENGSDFELDKPGKLADVAAALSTAPASELQKMLEKTDVGERVSIALRLLENEKEFIRYRDKISKEVEQEMRDQHEKMMLMGQLAAIKKELGLDQDTDADKLAEKFEKRIVDRGLKLPPAVREAFDEEVKRLRGMNPQQQDFRVSLDHLEWLTSVPWGHRSPDNLDLEHAQRQLDLDHFGLEDVKERILEFIAVGKLRREAATAKAKTEFSKLLTHLPKAQLIEAVKARHVKGYSRMSKDALASALVDVVDFDKIDREVSDLFPELAKQSVEETEAKSLDIDKEVVEHIKALQADPKWAQSGKILCLIGPPGVGKTSIGKSVAAALGREFYRLSVGGLNDVHELKGHRRTYIGALPGRFVQGLKRCGTENPVIMIDEIDKIPGATARGDPSSALLEVLDPSQNSEFADQYFDVPVDLSRVLFLTTANYRDGIPGPLADRMEFISLTGYTPHEKREIASRYLIPRAIERNGLAFLRSDLEDPKQHFELDADDGLSITTEAVDTLINKYCRESGVRRLDQHVDKLLRKLARKVAPYIRHDGDGTRIDESKLEELKPTLHIDATVLEKLLGKPKFSKERMFESTPVGVVMGLAYNEVGGSALYLESCVTSRDAENKYPAVDVTGMLGDVMKESMRIAQIVASSLLLKHEPDNKFFREARVHLHVPEGATPKDGPSAGVAAVLAFLSLATDTPLRPDLAMTGEVTTTGLVLPIGGVKQKAMAAMRAGITTLLLPAENKRDFEELPPAIRSAFEVHYLTHIRQAVAVAFPEQADKWQLPTQEHETVRYMDEMSADATLSPE